jgi:fucose permease
MTKNYRQTLIACYMGFITQAVAANFAPLLFLTFHETYGISLVKIAMISSVFFLTQIITDLLSAGLADRIGYRPCIVASEVLSALGLLGLAFLPDLFPDPFAGILVCVAVYAVGSGLIEVLCSPIVEACPFENKESVMSLLHSFYCWGAVGTILLSTVFFSVFGTGSWRILSCLWALIPLVNIRNFAVCPIEHLVEKGKSMTGTQLIKTPLFWLLVLLMVCSGASELAMAQWASAFTESALGVSKTVGDLAGPCLFAVLMGLSRVFYGKYGENMNIVKFMILSGILCVACYFLAALSARPVFGLVGCALCGFSVGIMWPGTISISAHTLTRGGTAMFALLAMAGDLGGALGPGLVGVVSQETGGDLKTGILLGCIFPVILVAGLLFLSRKQKHN